MYYHMYEGPATAEWTDAVWSWYTLEYYTVAHSNILTLPGNISRRQYPRRHFL